MRKLLGLAVVVILLLGADTAARSYAQGKLADRARQAAPEATDVTARISSFPFLGRLAVSEDVTDISLHFTDVVAAGLRFAAVDVDMHGVVIDRNELISQRKVRLLRIDHGTVAVELAASELSRALGAQVGIRGRGVEVGGTGGSSVTATPAVTGNRLLLRTANLPTLALAIPRTTLIPCAATVVVSGDRLRISCSINQVPPALLDVANNSSG